MAHHRRADRGRRGLARTSRRGGRRRRVRGARPDRRPVHVGGRRRRAAAAGRRRLRARAADVDAAPPRRAGEHGRDARADLRPHAEADALYRAELHALEPRARARRALDLHARPAPPPGGWTGRVDAACSPTLGPPPAAAPRVFVCGPTGFVEHVADAARRPRATTRCGSPPSASARPRSPARKSHDAQAGMRTADTRAAQAIRERSGDLDRDSLRARAAIDVEIVHCLFRSRRAGTSIGL